MGTGPDRARPMWRFGRFALLAMSVGSATLGSISSARAEHRYELEARLDPSAHVVEGRARIVWTNRSDEPVRELTFHLYLNAFANDETVFMRESRGQLRGVATRGRGSIEVLELETATGEDLLAGADTALEPNDATQMRVPLPRPVPPGGRIELRTVFRSRLPPLFARTGYADDFHVVAQWFPKLAKHEPDGRWVSFPYHGHGEFYADFARYDLTVRVPRGWTVGATGRQASERTGGGMVTRRYVAERVHDAAFVAWPHFEERIERVGPVEVRVLSPPGYGAAVESHLAITRAGLAVYGAAYGPYPYPVLTVVVPPRGAEGGAGMEYPTLFLTAGPWLPAPGVHVGLGQEVTAHELAHQWFQGLVASNEVRWPMLDEGLTTWASWDLLGRLFGRDGSALSLPGLRVDGFELMRLWAVRRGRRLPPPGSHVKRFRSGSYGPSVYARTALVLESVARTWGRARTVRALGTYARRHRFGHPRPADLYRAFDQVLWPGFSKQVLVPALEKGALGGVGVAPIGAGGLVRALRQGDLALPTRLEVRTPQARRSLRWPARERALERRLDARVLTVRADPSRALLLDSSVLDHARVTSPPPTRDWLLRGTLFLQTLLALVMP